MDNNLYLTTAEERLAGLIWENAPLTSPELVEMAFQALEWKKSTTYTVLKKLCDKGVFKNENAVVVVVLTPEELLARQSRRYVDDAFGGSLPQFVTSFIGGGKRLTADEAAALKRLIAEHEEGEADE